jgi:prolipoprotein diacylglyceryltransferase
LIGLGAVTGLAWTAALAPDKHTARWIDQGLWLLLGALLGGRLVHVITTWGYYGERPLDIPQVWLGGLSGPGALAGGLLTLGLVALLTRQKLGVLADGYLPLAAALVVSAWLASWADGAAYGAETSAWWGLPARNEWGDLTRRMPLQMIAALLSLVVFWSANRYSDPFRPGQASSLATIGLGMLILAVSLVRADPSPTWAGLRPESWAGLTFILLAAGAYLVSRFPLRWVRRSASAAETDILQ